MAARRRSLRLQAMEAPEAVAEAFPDEILTLVFSHLDDGRILLDVLPLVCKRWCRVARDPASWAGVALRIGAGNVMQEARILRRAPAAKSLLIEARHSRRTFDDEDNYTVREEYGMHGPCGPYERCRVRRALRCSRVKIRDCVSILEKGWWLARLPRLRWPDCTRNKTPKSSISRFLARQPDLRELRLHLADGDEGAACLAAIARMPHLRRLELTTVPGAAYNGQLAGALPELRELRVHAECPRDLYRPEPPRGLVGDLVRGARALRVLEVDMPTGADRTACAALRGVERLEINAFQDAAGRPRPVWGDAVAAVRTAFALLLEMKSPALRAAAVSLCRGEHARYKRKLQAQCRAVRDEFSLQMPDVGLQLHVDGPGCSECEDYWSCPGSAWHSEESDENSDSDGDEDEDEEDDEDEDEDEDEDGDGDGDAEGDAYGCWQ